MAIIQTLKSEKAHFVVKKSICCGNKLAKSVLKVYYIRNMINVIKTDNFFGNKLICGLLTVTLHATF